MRYHFSGKDVPLLCVAFWAFENIWQLQSFICNVVSLLSGRNAWFDCANVLASLFSNGLHNRRRPWKLNYLSKMNLSKENVNRPIVVDARPWPDESHGRDSWLSDRPQVKRSIRNKFCQSLGHRGTKLGWKWRKWRSSYLLYWPTFKGTRHPAILNRTASKLSTTASK